MRARGTYPSVGTAMRGYARLSWRNPRAEPTWHALSPCTPPLLGSAGALLAVGGQRGCSRAALMLPLVEARSRHAYSLHAYSLHPYSLHAYSLHLCSLHAYSLHTCSLHPYAHSSSAFSQAWLEATSCPSWCHASGYRLRRRVRAECDADDARTPTEEGRLYYRLSGQGLTCVTVCRFIVLQPPPASTQACSGIRPRACWVEAGAFFFV